MKRLICLFAVLLAGCATAQFPPPYVHNYWTTQAQAQVNSPIMNFAHEVTNNIRADAGLFRSARTFGNLTASSTNTIPLVVDDFTGTNIIAEFVNAVNGRSVIISSNADISIGAGIFSGDGSGLTNLPSSGASLGIVTNGGSGLNNNLTNTFTKGLTNVGQFTLTDDSNAASSAVRLTNHNGALYIGAGAGNADVLANSFTGTGSALTALNASQLTSGNVPVAVATSGSVIQCLVSNFTSTFSGTNVAPTWSNVVTIAFTPKSASSRVVIDGSGMIGSANAFALFMRLAKNRAALTVGDAAGSRIQCDWYGQSLGAGFCASPAATVIESPGATTTVEYSMQFATENTGTYFPNRTVTDTSAVNFGRGVCSLRVTEYAP